MCNQILKRSSISWKTIGKRCRAGSTTSTRGLRSSQLRKPRRSEEQLTIFAGGRGEASLSFLKGGRKMKKDVMKGIGNIAEEIVKELAGKSMPRNRTSGDTVGNIAD